MSFLKKFIRERHIPQSISSPPQKIDTSVQTDEATLLNQLNLFKEEIEACNRAGVKTNVFFTTLYQVAKDRYTQRDYVPLTIYQMKAVEYQRNARLNVAEFEQQKQHRIEETLEEIEAQLESMSAKIKALRREL